MVCAQQAMIFGDIIANPVSSSTIAKSGRTSERDRKMDSGDQPNVKHVVLYSRPIALARISIDIESAST